MSLLYSKYRVVEYTNPNPQKPFGMDIVVGTYSRMWN